MKLYENTFQKAKQILIVFSGTIFNNFLTFCMLARTGYEKNGQIFKTQARANLQMPLIFRHVSRDPIYMEIPFKSINVIQNFFTRTILLWAE